MFVVHNACSILKKKTFNTQHHASVVAGHRIDAGRAEQHANDVNVSVLGSEVQRSLHCGARGPDEDAHGHRAALLCRVMQRRVLLDGGVGACDVDALCTQEQGERARVLEAHGAVQRGP